MSTFNLNGIPFEPTFERQKTTVPHENKMFPHMESFIKKLTTTPDDELSEDMKILKYSLHEGISKVTSDLQKMEIRECSAMRNIKK